MNNKKKEEFKNLIIDLKEIFDDQKNKTFFCMLYYTTVTISFNDIEEDISELINDWIPSMLMIYDMKTKKEIEIYSCDFEYYKIEDNILTIQTNRDVIDYDLQII